MLKLFFAPARTGGCLLRLKAPVKIGKRLAMLADFWQRTVILIETRKGGATSVQRGVQFSI